MRYTESKNLKVLKTIFKDTQTIYEGREKTALLSYVQKQHNVFQSKKAIGEGGVHHYIISPISPAEYEKLTPSQKKIMEDESIQWSKNTFEKFGFIGSIEYNKDKSDVKYSNGFENIKTGFHLHLAVSDKYKIRGAADLLSLRENLAHHLSNSIDPDMRSILGVKNKEETEIYRREAISKKQKQNALENLKNSPNFLENSQAVRLLNNDLSKIFIELGIKHTIKNDLLALNKNERHHILGKKAQLRSEMDGLKFQIKANRNEIRFIDKFIKSEKEKMTDVERLFQSEFQELKHFYDKKLLGLGVWVQGEHQWFRKIKSDQLKNGEINTTQFLYQVAQNKSYWEYIKSDERKRHQSILKQHRKAFKDKLFAMGEIIINLQRDRLSVIAIAGMDKKKLDSKLAKYEEIGTKHQSHYEVFISRIDRIQKEIENLRAKKLVLTQSKIQKQHQKQQMIEKILQFDAGISGKGFEALSRGMEKKYSVKITNGGAEPDSIDMKTSTIHIKKPKEQGAFSHLLRGLMKITQISEGSILKSLNTKTLFKEVKEGIYSQFPQFKATLEQTQSLEDFIVIFGKLKEVYKKREEDYSPSM
ncbi:MAG: hypothetical protein PHO74_06720 [Weeksellaceae bacterium]|nr:hypothetical protein [Weeksellaceae bacterium]